MMLSISITNLEIISKRIEMTLGKKINKIKWLATYTSVLFLPVASDT